MIDATSEQTPRAGRLSARLSQGTTRTIVVLASCGLLSVGTDSCSLDWASPGDADAGDGTSEVDGSVEDAADLNARDSDADVHEVDAEDEAPDVDAEAEGEADSEGGADGDAGDNADAPLEIPGTWTPIEAGTFSMGSPATELGRVSNETQHPATLTHRFEIQTTEVTQADFESVTGYNPSTSVACGSACPVETVSWHMAAAYCNALSDRAVLASCYECSGDREAVICSQDPAHSSIYECPGYRLPTEAEWEYAARAGTASATYNGELTLTACEHPNAVLDPIAWFCGNAGDTPHPVGALAANPWGLFDMLGNVHEWTNDWYSGDLGTATVTDPTGPTTGTTRVVHGGHYRYDGIACRAAYRGQAAPAGTDGTYGFRPVRTLP